MKFKWNFQLIIVREQEVIAAQWKYGWDPEAARTLTEEDEEAQYDIMGMCGNAT